MDINARDINGRTMLHYSLCGKTVDLEMVQFLLEKGADPDIQVKSRHHQYHGYTALHFAVEDGKVRKEIRSLRLLLQHGADASIPDGVGRTPLRRAQSSRFTKAASLLEEYLREGKLPERRPSTGAAQRMATPKGAEVKVYAGPKAGQPVATVRKGETVGVIAASGEWMMVRLDESGEKKGWVKKSEMMELEQPDSERSERKTPPKQEKPKGKTSIGKKKDVFGPDFP